MSSLGYKAIDFDTHYYEPDDCFSRHIDPVFRDRALRVVPSSEPGIGQWAISDHVLKMVPLQLADRNASPGSLEDLFAGRATLVQTEAFRPRDHPAMMERQARYPIMDEQGIEAGVILPTMGVCVEHEFQDDAALCANFRGFNRWLEEDWGYGEDRRIFSVPVVSLLDVDFAVEETERVAGLGSRFVYIRTGPVAGRSPADPLFDPFWRTVEETGLKVVFHLDITDYVDLIAKHWSEDPHRSAYDLSPLQVYHSLLDRPIRDTMAALVLHNLFGRFPRVQVISIELGSGWLRPLLKDLDKAIMFGANGKMLGGKLPGLPSEILPQHLRLTPYYEDDIEDLVDLIGADRVLFGSDYPHPEGLKSPLSFVKGLAKLPEDTVRRIMRNNAAEVLGLALATTAQVDQAVAAPS